MADRARLTAASESGFHATFDCLWCGRPHTTRTPDDIEGWSQLCSSCVGKAQDNEFLRYRLRDGLRRRAEASETRLSEDQALKEYYAARAPEYDEFYAGDLRPPLERAVFQSDLDAATLWLDGLPISGEIVELAAGTGWWSALLAEKGELSIYDVSDEVLMRARNRLLAHGQRAHIHVRDAWAEPDRQVDVVFCGAWLSHVRRRRLGDFLAIVRRWLKPTGRFVFIDEAGQSEFAPIIDERQPRVLNDGRKFEIVKVFYEPDELESALRAAGFGWAEVKKTSRFFVLGQATAAKSLNPDQALRDYYAARATEYDDWYLRRGRYTHGEAADRAWATELDAARSWLSALPIQGEIVELAAGTGWWSPVLARKGELWLYDANSEPLAIAAERLRGLDLTAHVEVRDGWALPDRQVDALFMGFWLSHVTRARLGSFLAICRSWLKPGGVMAFIDSRPDPESSATNHPTPADDLSVRKLNDGRQFTIPKVYYTRADLLAALGFAGLHEIDVSATSRFFILGSAQA